MNQQHKDFCIECRKECDIEIKKVTRSYTIKEKEYQFLVTVAFCKECGEENNIPGIMDLRTKEIDTQYREAESIVTVNDIENLMQLYNIGKAPLSLALGFGEITITRYIQGQIPSKEYSDIIQKALESPTFMVQMLETNKAKIGNTAYTKSLKAAESLTEIFSISNKMLSVISYIFDELNEVTPLALQKMLYYIQALYLTLYNAPLYNEDCMAWTHGPVFENVYNVFKSFKYNPIEDNRFVILKNRFLDLTPKEKHVVTLVTNTFGKYSGKTLEHITHKEAPWIIARQGYNPLDRSQVTISKENIKKYFDKVAKEFNLNTKEGLDQYIIQQLG